MKVVCVGHSTFDTTLPVKEYPTENIKYRLEHHIECGGGPASNGAYLLAKWGMDTAIASVIGDDYYGDRIIADFEKVKADTSFLEKKENHQTTSSYIIANMSNGTRTVLSSKDDPVRKLSKSLCIPADVILIDGEHPESAHELLDSNPRALSVLDAGRLNDDTKELGKKVTYLVCSKDFAEEFSEKKIDINNLEELQSIYNLLKEYFETNIVITLEAAGSYTEIDGVGQIIPSIKVKALDSTGAGDIFHGAFTYFMANGYSLLDTIKFSSITSAISVTRIGSRYSIPLLDEVVNYDTAI
ncbi:MAG: carbohydrate kinase [Bacilli bacterium]|nr:carbohydrate kinase [Bacilli bacterium]